MRYATPVSILHETPLLHKRGKADDGFHKSNIDYENLEFKNDKRVAKGMILGLIFSIPIWILIISLIAWVIP